ncbi:phosphorelay sensor kinase [Aureococcus anophagefferens]|nr:phosphorelay sensor kinase [Aureococcus anophagefferens]
MVEFAPTRTRRSSSRESQQGHPEETTLMRRLSADGLDPTLMRRERTDSTGEVIPATVEKPLREAELLFEEQLESMQDAPAGPFGSLRRRSRRTQSAAATEYDTCDDYDDDDAYDEDYEDDDDDDGRAAPEERDRVKSDRHTRRRGGHHEQLGHNKRRSWEDVDALWCPVTHPWGEARNEVKVFEKPDAETKQRLRARVAASPALAALAPRTASRRWRLLKNTVLAVGALNDIVRQSREIHSNPVNRGSLRSHLKSWGVAADTQKQLVVPWFVFQPDDPTRVAWDTASALVMLMMIFYIPYNVSFVGPTYVYYVFDWFLTVFFTVDICLSFVTAYEHKGRTVTDPSKIARHYLRTFFLLDVVATFPMDIALAGQTKDKHKDLGRLAKASKLPRMFRYVRVFRFMRIVRVYGMDGIIQRAMVRAQLNPGMCETNHWFRAWN